jgi:DNA-binding transcriptional MerR regulator
MQSYSVRDIERVLRLSRSTIRGFIDVGFVAPTRGPRREYRFSFQDLIVLRAARALIEAKVSRRRIRRSLEDLRTRLPETMPLSGLSICAVGDQVVVRDGNSQWQVEGGQYVLGLDVTVEDGVLRVVEKDFAAVSDTGGAMPPPKDAQDWFDEGLDLEETGDIDGAIEAYRQTATLDSQNVAAWINWGRLLHDRGTKREAEEVYRRAIEQCGADPVLMFNLGVLLEDLGRTQAALEAYQSAVGEDPSLADGHYNLARLYEALGQPQHAIRHLGQYRRLLNSETR